MPNPNIIRYINQYRNQYSEIQLRQKLLEAGYDSGDVDRAFFDARATGGVWKRRGIKVLQFILGFAAVCGLYWLEVGIMLGVADYLFSAYYGFSRLLTFFVILYLIFSAVHFFIAFFLIRPRWKAAFWGVVIGLLAPVVFIGGVLIFLWFAFRGF